MRGCHRRRSLGGAGEGGGASAQAPTAVQACERRRVLRGARRGAGVGGATAAVRVRDRLRTAACGRDEWVCVRAAATGAGRGVGARYEAAADAWGARGMRRRQQRRSRNRALGCEREGRDGKLAEPTKATGEASVPSSGAGYHVLVCGHSFTPSDSLGGVVVARARLRVSERTGACADPSE